MGDQTDQVARSVELDARPEQVWEALVDPSLAPQWFGEEFRVEPRPGGRVTVADEGDRRRGTVEVADRPRRLTLRVWGRPVPGTGLDGSRIDFVIEPVTEGVTRLTVTETRLGSRPGARLAVGAGLGNAVA
jgi:uncharacterized protein YndB with AHSA1/START domain